MHFTPLAPYGGIRRGGSCIHIPLSLLPGLEEGVRPKGVSPKPWAARV